MTFDFDSRNDQFLTALIFLFFSIHVDAQETIRGVILSQSNVPIPFANVYVNDSTGTITNGSGLFELEAHFLDDDSLIISSIGYKSLRIPLSGIRDLKFHTLKLTQSTTILDEVIITPAFSRDTAVSILKKVLEFRRRNYSQAKYSAIAFYREANFSDSSYSRLLESWIHISSRGYSSNVESTRVKVLQLRKLKDDRLLDWRQSLSEWLYRENGIFLTLGYDRLSLKSKFTMQEVLESPKARLTLEGSEVSSFFSEEFLDAHDFFIKRWKIVDGNRIVEIGFHAVVSSYLHLTIEGRIFINVEDWAIFRMESLCFQDEQQAIQNQDRLRVFNNPMDDSVYYRFRADYKKFDEFYYPSYLSFSSVGTNSGFLRVSNFEDKFNSHGQSGNIYCQNELYFDEIIPFVKIKRNNSLSKRADLFDLDNLQDAVFWKKENRPPVEQIFSFE